MGQCLGNSVDEGFGTNEAMVRQQVSAKGQVLAAAKPDFEVEWAIMPEQPLRCDRPFCWHGDLGEKLVNQLLLARTQGFALASPIKPVESRWVAFLKCAHAKGDWRMNSPLSSDASGQAAEGG